MNPPARKLGLIGDVHAEHTRLAQALDYLQHQGVDEILCTGDIMDGIGCPEACIRLLQEAKVITVRGNHDRWVLEDKARHVANAHLKHELSRTSINYLDTLPKTVAVNTVDGTLLLCHGVADKDLAKIWPGSERMGIERSATLDEILKSGNYRYLVNGHMHFRTMIHFSTLTLINAGTLKGEHWPGFSVVDFDDRSIDAFEFRDGGIQHAKSHQLEHASHVIWENTQSFDGSWEPLRLF